MFIHTDTSILELNDCYSIKNNVEIKLHDFINHSNKLYGFNIIDNTLSIFDLSSNQLKLILNIDIQLEDVSYLSNLIIAKNTYFHIIIGFINNKEKTFEIYKLNEHNIPLLHTHTTIQLNNDISNIKRILFQDGFFYLQSLSSNDLTNIYILKPDFSYFGNFSIPDKCNNIIMAGKYIFYSNEKSVKKYDILRKKIINIIDISHEISTFTFNVTNLYIVDLNNHFYIYNFDCTHPNTYILNETIFKIYESKIKNIILPIHKIIQSNWGDDFQHTVSKMTNSYVDTYFPCQMDRNQKYINDFLAELAVNIYSNSDNIQIIKTINTSKINIESFKDFQNYIVFGNDIQDILEPPHNFLNKYYAYQHILNDMESLMNISDKTHLQQFIEFVKNKGVDINHPYIMSGRFHLMKPNHAKGWHNNIESVPKGKAEIIYFVISDVHEYGGSFFLYQHPYSKLIHAVPDVSGTYKKFNLIGNKESPLWHAIGSFTANRISLGYSKRSELELYNQTKKEIFN